MIIFENQIKYCKICFEPIKDYSFHNLFVKNNELCEQCFSRFNAKFISFYVQSIKCIAIYEYNQKIKDLIFKFKGCYDIELKDVFLARYISFLRIKYCDFCLVPIPSNRIDDERRGFNHVEMIYSGLKLPILKVLEKTKNHKQAKSNIKLRINAQEYFKIIDVDAVKNKKILIVDDIYTSGSSVNAAINLIKQGKPKKIEVLVVAKSIDRKTKT